MKGLNCNQLAPPLGNQLMFSEDGRIYFLLEMCLRNSVDVVNSMPSLDYSAPSQSVGLVGHPSAAWRCYPAPLLAPFLLNGSEISAVRWVSHSPLFVSEHRSILIVWEDYLGWWCFFSCWPFGHTQQWFVASSLQFSLQTIPFKWP